MCESLLDLRAGLGRYAAGFDAALLSGPQAQSVVEAATAVERMAAVLKAKAAGRVAETRCWKGAGERSAASHLARATASTLGQAGDAIATAKRLETLPTLDAAARGGELSAEQTAAIADAATADPSAEARLVAKAAHFSLPELRAECARIKAMACPDLEARRRRIHQRRSLRDWTDADGTWHLHLRHSPEVGAAFMAALAPLRHRLFKPGPDRGPPGTARGLRRRCPGGDGVSEGGARRRHREGPARPRRHQGHRARRPPGAAAGVSRRG